MPADPTPVEIAAEALHAGCSACDGSGTVTEYYDNGISRAYQCESLAQLTDLLTRAAEVLHAAGWRIVKTGATSAFDPPDDWVPGLDDPPGWDRSGVFYDDDDRPDGCVPLYRIVDEWTPGGES